MFEILFRSRPGFLPAVDAHLPDVDQRVIDQFRSDARRAAREASARR